MFRRFASASSIVSIGVACAVLVVLLMPPSTQERVRLLTVVWCLVPAVWGLWAMVAPAGWVPQRLPVWGAILGLMAGFLVAFVLDLPSRIAGGAVPAVLRGIALVAIVLVYYLLWMLVRVAYRSLGAQTTVA